MKISHEVTLAYRAVRRIRGGFHNVRQKRLAPFVDTYVWLYSETLRLLPGVLKVQKYGNGTDLDRARALFDAELDAVQCLIQTQPPNAPDVPLPIRIKPKDHDIGLPFHRKNFLARFENKDSYVEGKMADIRSWGGGLWGLTAEEQYEALVVSQSYIHHAKVRTTLYEALSRARALHLESQNAPSSIDALFQRKLVPTSRRQASDLTRLSKLIVGENVRLPTTKMYHPQPHELTWYSDDRVVNKLARQLKSMDLGGVAPSDVPTWLKERGGAQAAMAV